MEKSNRGAWLPLSISIYIYVYAECVDKLKIKDKTIYVIYQSDNNYVNGLAPSQIEYIEV